MTKGLKRCEAKSNSKVCRPISFKIYMIITLLALSAILILSWFGYQIVSLNKEVNDENAKHQIIAFDAYNGSKNETLQDASNNKLPNLTKVHVGVYLDNIKEMNIKDSKWRSDFTIWFSWYGNDSNAGENFHIINGDFDKDNKQRIKGNYNKSSKFWYYKYELKDVTITDDFDTRLYPFDNQLIGIKIEDLNDNVDQLIYESDDKNSSISEQANLTGFEVSKLPAIVCKDIYNTNFGDPNKNISNKLVSSQYNFVLSIKRPNKALLFLSIFQGLIVAVLISLIALFVKPTFVDPRFGLGVGGLFAAVANYYITSSALPIAGIVTITGLIHGIGISVIFFNIAQSILSLYIYDSLEAIPFSERFDRDFFFFILSLIIIVIASLHQLWL